jgi:hypothetical protein
MQNKNSIFHKHPTRFTTTITSIKTARLLFGVSIVVIAFYLSGYVLIGDIYRYAVVGAIYELLWLPMLLSLVVIPLISTLILIKNKGERRTYAALALLLIIGSIIILIYH